MHLETIDRGIDLGPEDSAHVSRAVRAGLDQYSTIVQLLRVRLLKAGVNVRCKMRAWCGPGPTIVVAEVRPSAGEAIDAAVDTLQRAIRRKRGRTEDKRKDHPKRTALVASHGG